MSGFDCDHLARKWGRLAGGHGNGQYCRERKERGESSMHGSPLQETD